MSKKLVKQRVSKREYIFVEKSATEQTLYNIQGKEHDRVAIHFHLDGYCFDQCVYHLEKYYMRDGRQLIVNMT